MRSRFLAILVLSLVPILSAADFDAKVERQMFDLVNKERTERGLPALTWSDKLQQSARTHTEKIAARQILSHRFSEEPAVPERIAATGLHFSATAENLASTSGDPIVTPAEDLHAALMGSSGHRANILDPKYTALGIGVIHHGDTYFATQNFALTTASYSDREAEQRLISLIQQARAKVNLPRIEVVMSQRLRDAICAESKQDALAAQPLIVDQGYFGVSAATVANLDIVPPSLKKVVFSPTLKKMAVGACFQVTPKYPGGMYWLAFEY